jgi:hypothetical protein
MRTFAALAIAAACSLPGRAWAQPAAPPADAPKDAAREQALVEFREGVALMAAENWAAALVKLKSAGRFAMSAQVAFNIAECEQKLGKLVSALGNYRLAMAKAQASNVENVLKAAPPQIEDLEKRIAKLTVIRKEETVNPKATIDLDGVELGSTQIGTAFRTDPGDHTLRVLVDGKAAKTERIKLADGEVKEVTIEIPAPSAGTVDVGPPPDEPAGPSIPGIVLVSVGGAALIAGGVFIGLRQVAISDLDEQCGGDESCPPSAEETYDRGRLMTGLAEVFIPVGVAAGVTGAVLLATMSGSSKKSGDVEALSLLSPDGTGPGFGIGLRF